MSRTRRALIAIALVIFGASLVAQQNAPAPAAPIPAGVPEWAYTPPNPPGTPPAPSALPADDNAVVRIPGTARTLTRGQLRGVLEIPDWYPEDRHGPVPAVVKVGRLQEGVRACGFCHLADGTGRPENASVNGLHVAYFIQQMDDFKNGLRHSADPRKGNTNNMIGFAKNATAEEVRTAAEYFAAQPYPKRMKVIESRTAPKVRLQGGMHMPIVGEGAGMEPIGDHIVEVPDDHLRAEARDTRMGYTVYVPAGSLDKGKALAARHQCAVCHGANLEGIGPVPPLAGRSPSYTMRQLFDMKEGTRRGPWSALMKPIVDKMSVQDMANLSAYTASLVPSAAGARGTR
jgi:cytochrome c553